MQDLIYTSMESAIRKDYNRAGMDYDPSGKIRNTHLTFLQSEYRAEHFSGLSGADLNRAKVGFLTQLQNMIDIRFGLV